MDLSVRELSIFRRLQERFLLKDRGEPVSMAFSTEVLPVTAVDELLRTSVIALGTVDSGAAPGWVTMITVPVSRRWIVRLVHAIRASGNFTFTAVALGNGARWIDLNRFSATADTAFQVSGMLKLESGWQFRVYVDAVTSAGDLSLYVLVEEEVVNR